MVHLSMTNIMNKFRIGEVRGWHIIYQLSDGTWASKNRHRRSTNRAHSRHERLWQENNPLYRMHIVEFPGENIYLAIRPRRGR